MTATRIPRKPRHFIGHLERYIWATQYCLKKKVLDLGCKDGYGAHIISAFANEITLLDNDQWRLDKAKELYKFLCPEKFKNIDLEKEFSAENYDVIIAFELIEHVANRELLLENIAKHLNPGGKLLFSVPHMIENYDHTHLYDERGIKEFIGKYLKIEEFFIQDKIGLSSLPATSPPKSYVGVAI